MNKNHYSLDSGMLYRGSDYQPPKSWRSFLIGRPLSTADAPHQTVGKAIGLAVFASDALASTGYATQEILVILAVAGFGALKYAFPISIVIVALLVIVTMSYEQTVHTYTNGGGSYIVARDNLGIIPAQVAGAALLTDYILTVAVSISSGVAQLVSAYSQIAPYRVHIAIGLVLFIMLINLRGVRESGLVFSIPTYSFIFAMLVTVGVGVARYALGTLGPVVEPPPVEMVENLQPLTMFLILLAFSSGTSAMTGIEAVSNGITAFREPRSHNAGVTLIWMSTILSVLFLGITFLSVQIQAIPSESETIISQLIRTVFGGRNIAYLLAISATTLILVIAANTAFADFPRLSALVAMDGFLPRQLAFRGSRLVYSRGIVALALIASLLIFIFQARVTALIPLYAIGVFLSFTLSQAGMAHRWWKSGKLRPGEAVQEPGSTLIHDRAWRVKMVVNGFGAICTAVVVVVFAVTKFKDGAWIVLVIIPALVWSFLSIHKEYRNVAKKLTLEDFGSPRGLTRQRVLLLISGVHRGTLFALNFARSISDDVTAVHVVIDPDDAEKVRQKWSIWGDGTRMVFLDSQFRLLVEPLLEYIEEVADQSQPGEVVTVVVPNFVSHSPTNNLLHARTAEWLRRALIHRPGVVIVEVPYQID
ncbi:MAG: APC family permease [Anaerolineales bacterium]|jgi:amino acid transporter|nr:APC family permease [Anaerolineales bacterium]